jgi:hypothetical protein
LKIYYKLINGLVGKSNFFEKIKINWIESYNYNLMYESTPIFNEPLYVCINIKYYRFPFFFNDNIHFLFSIKQFKEFNSINENTWNNMIKILNNLKDKQGLISQISFKDKVINKYDVITMNESAKIFEKYLKNKCYEFFLQFDEETFAIHIIPTISEKDYYLILFSNNHFKIQNIIKQFQEENKADDILSSKEFKKYYTDIII